MRGAHCPQGDSSMAGKARRRASRETFGSSPGTPPVSAVSALIRSPTSSDRRWLSRRQIRAREGAIHLDRQGVYRHFRGAISLSARLTKGDVVLRSPTVRNFTDFENADLPVVGGLNVTLEESATNKTHLLTLHYAVMATNTDEGRKEDREGPIASVPQTRTAERLAGIFRPKIASAVWCAVNPGTAAAKSRSPSRAPRRHRVQNSQGLIAKCLSQPTTREEALDGLLPDPTKTMEQSL